MKYGEYFIGCFTVLKYFRDICFLVGYIIQAVYIYHDSRNFLIVYLKCFLNFSCQSTLEVAYGFVSTVACLG